MKKVLLSEDKLDLLRKADGHHNWGSLDDKRSCILCEWTFSGRQVLVARTRGGRVVLHCPTPGCVGTPHEWVRPGNPLISEEAWNDWARLMERVEKTTATLATATGRHALR